jgi:hypothetical protein
MLALTLNKGMPYRSLGIVLAWCVLGCAVIAQDAGNSKDSLIWKPPLVLQSDTGPKPVVGKPMIGKLRVFKTDILLEETEIAQIQEKFGGELGSEGDAGDFLAWLCLRGSDETGPWVLWLESSEIDGGGIGAFQWRRVARDAKFDKRCAVLPGVLRVVELPVPLHLGMAEAKVVQLLGRPTARQGKALLDIKEHEGLLHGVPFWEYNAVTLVIRDGAVWVIQVQKSTTS